jgi:hypothetical protein
MLPISPFSPRVIATVGGRANAPAPRRRPRARSRFLGRRGETAYSLEKGIGVAGNWHLYVSGQKRWVWVQHRILSVEGGRQPRKAVKRGVPNAAGRSEGRDASAPRAIRTGGQEPSSTRAGSHGRHSGGGEATDARSLGRLSGRAG